MNENCVNNYFLYCRKSTDTEDKQVLSISAQLSELRSLAKRERLHIKEIFVEKQSAKIPGRPIFTDMLARIEKGEAQGILCWKLDRLARNPIDGGQISWMLQRGTIQHIQTHDRGYFPADNVLMMSVEFGMANQYILDLSQNTSRGLREKARRGIYPGLAPVGYLNDPRTKTVIIDRRKSKIVKRAFELYATNSYRLEDIAAFFKKNGIVSWGGKLIHLTRISFILTNPFYCGLFRYAGELHEGKHEPIITMELFDRVQKILKERARPHREPHNQPRPLCGLIRCGMCGMGITAEIQKGHVYYRCSKKSKTIKCSEPFIREEELNRQLSAEMQKVILPENWAKQLYQMLAKDEQNIAQSSAVLLQGLQEGIKSINSKLQRLLDTYLDQDIEQETYRQEKSKLVLAKKTLEEKIDDVEQGRNSWLEPMREWLKDAQNIREIAENNDLFTKKSFAKKIFGSNLMLSAKKISGRPENEWAALAAANKKTGLSPDCQIVVALYEATRTYFIKKYHGLTLPKTTDFE